MLDTGNDAVKYPAKLVLLEPPETRPNRSLTLPSLTTSPAKVLHIPSRTTTTQALPRARAPLPNRRNPPLPTFPRNLEKTGANSQERQCHLDNKLCLFCGTSGHFAKDCPKSTSASSKARVSKTDQEKSTSTNSDSKKD